MRTQPARAPHASAYTPVYVQVLASATTRMDAFIDRTLALSNASQLIPYITGDNSKQGYTGAALVRLLDNEMTG